MEFAVVVAALPLLVAFAAWLGRLNIERSNGTPWGDAFLRAGTRGIYVFGVMLAAEIGLGLLVLLVAWLSGAKL